MSFDSFTGATTPRQAQLVVSGIRAEASQLVSVPWDVQNGRSRSDIEREFYAGDSTIFKDIVRLERLDSSGTPAQIRTLFLEHTSSLHGLLRVVGTRSDVQANKFDRAFFRPSWRTFEGSLRLSDEQFSDRAGAAIRTMILVAVAVMLATVAIILVLFWRISRAESQRRLAAEVAHAAIELQNERLREVDRMKDDFVASVSHDLRTPLTSIRGYIELVLDDESGALSDEQRRCLGVVDRNSDRLLRLVGDLLFVAQVDAGRLKLVPTELDLARVCGEAVEGLLPRAQEHGVKLVLAGEASLPVRADGARLAQLLDNLLSNALKFTPSGGSIEVRVSARPGVAVLEVADTGSGIPPAEQAALFDRFFRSEAAVTKVVPGTGLTIAKAIVDAHSGTITCSSEEGAGTTFRIELPVLAGTQPGLLAA